MTEGETVAAVPETAEQGRVIENVGVLDWRSLEDASGLAGIAAIRNVGTILIADDLAGALAGIPTENVGSIVPVPRGVKVSLQTGQTRFSGEALAMAPEDTILLLVGQALITTPVTKVGYREIRFTGQMVAPRGSETALGAKITQMTGQVVYYPWLGEQVELRTITGDESLSGQFFEYLPGPIVLMAVGDITFEESVTVELLRSKVQAMVLVGDIFVPRELLPAVQALSSERAGDIIAYPKGARFLTGEETIGSEYLEYLPDASALVMAGKITLTADVTADLLKQKVREIVLGGMLVAPRATLGLLRALMTTKSGVLRALEDEPTEDEAAEE
ncbi:MAG: hypothetical protein ACYC5O_13895 [Anaerolineae bacterium]